MEFSFTEERKLCPAALHAGVANAAMALMVCVGGDRRRRGNGSPMSARVATVRLSPR